MRSGLFLLFLVALALSVRGAEPEKRPNILFFIADDWGRHASVYGDPVVQTPVFDRVAREGALFWQAYCASPSCTPSRASILTGRAVHQLEEGAHLWSVLPPKFAVYPDLLERAGYEVGCEGKGWAPGDLKSSGRTRNPAGPTGKWEQFYMRRDPARPFCFWFGSMDPHRPYDEGSGAKAGLKADAVKLPPFWPDTPEVRSDVLDYYAEVQRFDARVGEIVAQLEKNGELDNTLLVISSDNGMPFPRAKANVYDAGANVPLAIRWPPRVKAAQVFREDGFVVLTDLAPTFLEAAGLPVPAEMTGRSLLPLLAGTEQPSVRDHAFLERERHAHVRAGNLSYPVRAVRTREFLYIRNLRPDRWPAGDPEPVHSVGEYGDIDGGPTKGAVLAVQRDPNRAGLARLSLGKRPEEEFYDLRKDPHQIENLAGNTEYTDYQKTLRASLDAWMRDTADPRATHDDDHWDQHPYTGPRGRERGAEKKAMPR